MARDWEKWLEAVDAEVNSLTREKEALKKLTPEEHQEIKRKAEEEGRKIEYLPTKVVFTVKPIPGAFKRKVRWVVCGNLEPKKEGEQTYSGGADATALRVLIWASAKYGWKGCVLDIKTAFLNACMEQDPEEDVLLLRPPSIFIEKGYLDRGQVYQPLKAVYGFRRSPRLWGNHRDEKMRGFRIKVKGEKAKTLKLLQLGSEPNLWKVVEDRGKEDEEEEHWLTNGTVLGLVMTYVDDIFIAAKEPVVTAVKEKIQETWATSVPEEVTEEPVRFLGMDILKVLDEGKEAWMITQESYVKDLIGKQDMEEKEKKIPITKDQALMEPDKETPSLEKIRQCQKEVGEILWLITRSRPDLMFSTSRMGSHVTKSTASVLDTASQIRGYLRKTAAQGLMYQEDPEEDVCVKVFTDASFSPEGEESHGCFLVFINRCLIFWRSGRQPTITLSTAESELNELIEGMTGGEAVAVILYELCEGVKRQAWTDSQSAASIMVNEGGSWRTRHLKMRAGYARQQVMQGEWMIGHIAGQDMTADVGTKPLPSTRLEHLKDLMRMRTRPENKDVDTQEDTKQSEERKEKNASMQVAQTALAMRLITLAASLQAARGQEEEEGAGELYMMMWIYTLIVVVLTILAQWMWKVGVRQIEAQPQGLSQEPSRSLPASTASDQEESQDEEEEIRSLQQRVKSEVQKKKEEKASGSRSENPGEKGLEHRGVPVRLPARLGEEGLGQRTDPVRLPSTLRGEASSGGGDRTELPREASLRGEERELNLREGGIQGARGTGGGDRAPNPREEEKEEKASGSRSENPGEKGLEHRGVPVRLPGRLGEEGLGQRTDPVRLPSTLRGEASSGGGDRTELPREASLRGEEREVNPREGGIRGARGTGGGDRAPNPREGESPSEQGRGLDQRGPHSSSSSAQSTEPLRQGPTTEQILSALESIKRDEDQLWSQIQRGAPLPAENETQEGRDFQLGFQVLRSPCGTVYHLRRHCRHLRGPQVGRLTEYEWCDICKGVLRRTRGRPPPGCPLYLPDHGNQFHTDQRCPRFAASRLVRSCLNCCEAEGVV